MGELVEYLMQEAMVQVVCGYGKMDRPKGMMALALKFLIVMTRHVKSTQVFTHKPNHMALFSLLENISMGLRQDSLQLSAAEKQTLIKFLLELTVKISTDCPSLADLLLADQTAKGNSDQRYNYIPL